MTMFILYKKWSMVNFCQFCLDPELSPVLPAKNPEAKPGLEFDIWNRKFIICGSPAEGVYVWILDQHCPPLYELTMWVVLQKSCLVGILELVTSMENDKKKIMRSRAYANFASNNANVWFLFLWHHGGGMDEKIITSWQLPGNRLQRLLCKNTTF